MTRHLVVAKDHAQETIGNLQQKNFIDHTKKIQEDGDTLLIPILDSAPDYPLWEIRNVEPRERSPKNRPVSTKASFDQIGSAAILKIRDRERAIKVAMELINGSSTIKSVFLDTGIQGEHRLRTLSLLAGEENYIVDHRENSLRFRFDLRDVYFSPRLATERLLVAKRCSPGHRVLDMFSGIGPFAITIARIAGSTVTAFDRNPECIRWISENVRLNHVENLVDWRLGDSRKLLASSGIFHRIVMNLPHSAFEFLDDAVKHITPGGLINYYEICNLETLETRMEAIRELGLRLVSKRIVHGYAPGVFMHSLELKLS